MDAITPPFNPASNSRRGRLPYIVVLVLLLAAILGGSLWYANRGGKQVKQIVPVFDPARQSVPKGATSLRIAYLCDFAETMGS